MEVITVTCPSGQPVTKEECDRCGQCRPSKWKERKLMNISELFNRIPSWRWTRPHKLIRSHGKKHGRPKKMRKTV